MTSPGDHNRALIASMISAGVLTSERLAAALAKVPRHAFMPPGTPLTAAYADSAVVLRGDDTSPDSTVSHPSAVVRLVQHSDLIDGHRVLDVGSGSGYQAAVMAHMVGVTGEILGIEIDSELMRRAELVWQDLGLANIQGLVGDAGDDSIVDSVGEVDRIVVTATCVDIPPAWFHVLRQGGRLTLPMRLGYAGPEVLVVLRREDGGLCGAASGYSRFVPMRGMFSARGRTSTAAGETDVTVAGDRPEEVTGLLQTAVGVDAGTLRMTLAAFGNLSFWLGLAGGDFVFTISGSASVVPALYYHPQLGAPSCIGVKEGGGFILLERPADIPMPTVGAGLRPADSIDIRVRGYGDYQEASARFDLLMQLWTRAGEPAPSDLSFEFRRHDADAPELPFILSSSRLVNTVYVRPR